MNHSSIRELISAFIDGELDDAQSRFVREHLEGCADCREFERVARTLSADIRSIESFLLPEAFSSSVLRTARKAAEEQRLWSPVEITARRFVTGLAAAVVLFVSLAMIDQPEEPVVIEPYLAGEQVDSSTTRTLLAKDAISKDDILLAAVTRK